MDIAENRSSLIKGSARLFGLLSVSRNSLCDSDPCGCSITLSIGVVKGKDVVADKVPCDEPPIRGGGNPEVRPIQHAVVWDTGAPSRRTKTYIDYHDEI